MKAMFYKKLVICFILFWVPGNGHAGNQEMEEVVLSLQWFTQSQFAGYYCALENGYYRDEGIELTIVPGASDKNPLYSVSSSMADFGTKWLADFMAARGEGLPLISIAQIIQKNGLVMIAKSKTGIQTPADFIDKRVGIWFFGNETQFFSLLNQLKLPLEQIHVGEIKWSIQPFLNDDFDVTMAMIYNEYLRVLDSGFQKQDINIIDFSDYGLNYPGQVLFTSRTIYETRPDLCQKMFQASVKGWAWAMQHPDKAVDIVMKYDKTKTLQRDHQLRQMKEMIKLIDYGNRPLGYHSPEQLSSVMESLLENKVLPHPLDLNKTYTNRFFQQAHDHEGSQQNE
jgi:NitT/TauT family transport system substrate-binding protein